MLAKGFRPVIVSDIVPAAVTEACGLQQRSGSSIKYVLEQDKSLCVSGTSGYLSFMADLNKES